MKAAFTVHIVIEMKKPTDEPNIRDTFKMMSEGKMEYEFINISDPPTIIIKEK